MANDPFRSLEERRPARSCPAHTALEACRVVECRPRCAAPDSRRPPGAWAALVHIGAGLGPPLVARDVTVRLLDPRSNEWMEENDER